MENSIETIGLRINRATPSDYSTGVDVNSIIEVEFNSDLDTKSIYGNFHVLKDTNRLLVGKPSSIDVKDFEPVKGSLSYKDRVIIFKPVGQLDKSCRYILYVPKYSIKDFKGRVSMVDYISSFDTDGYSSDKPCNVIFPTDNSVINTLTKIEVENIGAEKYIIQISKNKDFENGVYDRVVSSNIVTDDISNFGIGEGSYYIRAKSTNGDFGITSFFTLRTLPDTLVSDEDEPFIYQALDGVDNLITLEESFPTGINVHEKTNVSYMKFDGIVNLSDIDFYESGLFEKGVESEEYENEPVEGVMSVIHDTENNVTYMAFIKDSI